MPINNKKKNSARPHSPRKEPRQKRSIMLYNNILTTAKMLFEEQGYAYVSTNLIAERANISIGSLYQYFSNGESIALAIYEEASAKAALKMKQTAVQIIGLPMKDSVPIIISNLISIFEEDRFALLQLIDEVTELRMASQPISFDSLIHRTTQTYLEQNFPLIDKEVIACKVYIVEKSVIGTIRRYLEEGDELFSREQITQEMSQLVWGYLRDLG